MLFTEYILFACQVHCVYWCLGHTSVIALLHQLVCPGNLLLSGSTPPCRDSCTLTGKSLPLESKLAKAQWVRSQEHTFHYFSGPIDKIGEQRLR